MSNPAAETAPVARLGTWLPIIYAITFATGVAGLIYQVVWQRYLTRITGAETTSTAIILAVFLGGLSLGYWASGQLSTRVKRPLAAYALLEAGIGLWAIAFPMLFGVVQAVTVDWGFRPVAEMLGQGFLVTLALVGLPATLMGSTVPLLTRGLAQSLEASTRVHAFVYAINTLGAFAGALGAGFFFIEQWGLVVTMYLAAAINLLAGAIFFFGAKVLPAPPPKEAETPATVEAATATPVAVGGRGRPAYGRWALLLVAFLSGFYTMALQNVLMRLLGIVFGSSPYTFAMVVAVFILCIALGSFTVGGRREVKPTALFANQLGIALSLLALYFTLDQWPYWGHLLRIVFNVNDLAFWFYQAAGVLGLTVLLGIPLTLIGATVPLTFHEARRHLHQVGSDSGWLLSLNGLGSLSGSLIGGLLVFSFLHLGQAFVLSAALAGGSALVAAQPLGLWARGAGLGAAVAALAVVVWAPGFTKENYTFGWFRVAGAAPESLAGPAAFYAAGIPRAEIAFFRTDVAATIAVIDERRDPVEPRKAVALVANGRSESAAGDDSPDRPTQLLGGHLPMLTTGETKNVFVIGLGTGVSAGHAGLYPGVERIVVADVVPSVFEVLPLFADYNFGLHRDPRYEPRLGDALRLLRRDSTRWDAIISIPSHPFVTGVDQLFNREFFRLAKSRLQPRGVLMQWLQGYATSPDVVGLIVHTLLQEFPAVYAIEGGRGDYLLLASPTRFDATTWATAQARYASSPIIAEQLALAGVANVEALFRRRFLPELYLLAADEGPRLGFEIENHPRLVYWAGRAMFSGQTSERIFDVYRDDPRLPAIEAFILGGFLPPRTKADAAAPGVGR